MTKPLPLDQYCDGFVLHDDRMNVDLFQGPCIKNGYVRGLDVDLAEGVVRHGELVVKSAKGMLHMFAIYVTHQILIPENVYTLLGCKAHHTNEGRLQQHWTVGRQLPNQTFEKVSVVVIDDWEEVKRLEHLDIAQKSDNYLL